MANPYGGTYRPSGSSLSMAEMKQALKGIKVKAPNRKQTTASYKSGIQKEHESGGNG